MDKHFYESINGGTPTCIDDDIPFDIPDSWEWVRARSIVSVERGGSPRPIKAYITESEDGINWIKIGDSKIGSKYIYSTKEKIKPDGVKRSRTVKVGDLLLSNSMSFGRAYILRTNGCIHDGWLVLHPYLDSLNREYLYYLFASITLANQFKKLAKGSTVSNLNEARVSTVLIPLPPILEQKTIVSAIEQRFRLLNAILKTRVRYRRILSETPTSLRQQLIQAAIQGQLVSQNPNDEPASVLLERIAQERTAKLGKKAAKSMSRIERRGSKTYIEISPEGKEKDISEEIPFDISQNWEWCRLEQIGDAYIGLTYSPSDIRDKGTAVLRANNIQNGKISYDEVLHVETDIPERAYINKGDLLICARNGSKNLVGKTAIVERNGDAYGAFMAKFVSVSSQYLYYFFSSQFFREQLDDANTTTIYQVTQSMLKRLLCPIPPAAEQVRICDRLGLLLKTLDN